MQNVAVALRELRQLSSSEPFSRLVAAFDAAGHEFALVGGSVRDPFLGGDIHDLDATTSAHPDEILRIVSPVVDTHWDIGRQFGTIGVRLAGVTVEITTYRADSYDGQSRKPVVAFGNCLEEDLLRRDFTINALALRLPQLELVDPTGGMEDLVAGRLRTPGDAERSFSDDPLRMLRAARFIARFGFQLDPQAREAMATLAPSLAMVSAERIRDEFSKLLFTDAPRAGLTLLVNTGVAAQFLPELPALRLEIDEHHHHKDVYQHSLTVLDQAIDYESSRGKLTSPDLVLRLAALLHDIGKPATRRLEPRGAVSFYHHDVVGAKLARKRLRELRYDNDTIAAVSKLIELHLRFFGYADASWTDSAVRRYVRDAGDQLERLHILTRADVTTRNRRKADRLGFAYDDLEERITALATQEELDAVRPELNGLQIQNILGIKPGREVGEAYKYLLELRLDEGILGEEVAAERLRRWWTERRT